MTYTYKNQKLESAIALPFSINSYGLVNKTNDQSKIWADRVLSVIGTQIDERIFRPGFGTDTASSVFNTVSATTEAVQNEIRKSFEKWLPTLGLDSIDVSYNDYDNYVQVEVTYSLPDDRGTGSTIGVVAISGNLIPIEERR